MESFEDALAALLNKFGKDAEADLPDFILAKHLNRIIQSMGEAKAEYEHWGGGK